MIYLSKYQDNPAPEPVKTEASHSMSLDKIYCQIKEVFGKSDNNVSI